MRYIILILLVIVCQTRSHALDSLKIDSLRNVISVTSDSVEKYNSILEMAQLYINTNRAKSDSLASKALSYAISANQMTLHSEALSLLGYICYKDQKDMRALQYYYALDSLLGVNNIKNKLLLRSKLYQSQIAKYSYTDEGVERSKELLDEMLNIAKEINDTHYEHLAYLNIGGYYSLLYNTTRNIDYLTQENEYYLKALNYFLEKNDEVNIAKCYWFLSDVERSMGNMAASEEYLIKRVTVLKKANRKANLANAYRTLGGFNYRYAQDYQRAITFYDSAMALYQKEGFTDAQHKLGLFNGYALTYKELGQFEKGFEYLDKAYSLRDSLQRNRLTQTTVELETKYQTQKKEQEIELLTAQNELVQAESRNQFYILMVIIIAVLTLSVILYMLYRNRQKTAQKLQELDKIKSDFFANISHEFRTPLTLIKSPLEAKLNNGILKDEDRNTFENINRNADRLLSLVDQLLDLSRLESGGMKLNVEEASLGKFLEASVASFEYMAVQKNITFNRQLDCEGAQWFDKDVVEKIAVNLISNAIKYTPEDSVVSCSLICEGKNAKIIVTNGGKKINLEELHQLFDRFYQSDAGSDGVGIGLALVKELVNLHHGDIELDSQDDQTEFVVNIPVSRDAYQKGELKTSPSETNSVAIHYDLPEEGDIEDPGILSDNPLLLIVEDNHEVRKVVASLFEDSYTVLEAEDGDMGIEKAIKYIPDVIVSDVMMPNKNGVELAETLKQDERTSHIPIILLTAKAGEDNILTGLETGADDYLVKPFSNEVLKLRVKKLVELRAQLRLRYSQEVVLRPKDMAITSADEKFLERLQVILDQHLTDPLFNAEIFSKEIGMSRMQLHRKLKALVGLTTTEFIRSQRLKMAAHLLEGPDINMSEVGYSVGFNDPSYFAKCFKETYDCTPKQYADTNKT